MKKLIIVAGIVFSGLIASVHAQQKMAHVNTEEVLLAMPEVTQMQNALEQKAKEYEAQLGALYTEYETKVKELQEQGESMMQSVLEAKYQYVTELEQRIIQAEQKAQDDLAAYESKLLAPIEEKALNAIKSVARSNGYDYVFDDALLLHSPPGDDITTEVKQHLKTN